MREVTVITIDETHLDRMGIYRIWFGSYYYIGATINTFNRMKGHNCAINQGFSGKRHGKNSITNIVLCLVYFEDIHFGFMELVEPIEYEEQLVDAEQKWLTASTGDKYCLNEKMVSYRKVGGLEIRPTFVEC